MSQTGLLIGRILISVLFLISGASKYINYEGTQIYMDIMGLPGGLLPIVLVVEIGGAFCLMSGWLLRPAALILAGFCLLTAAIFHTDFSQHIEVTSFLKNIAIAGGLVVLASAGAGKYRLTLHGKKVN